MKQNLHCILKIFQKIKKISIHERIKNIYSFQKKNIVKSKRIENFKLVSFFATMFVQDVLRDTVQLRTDVEKVETRRIELWETTKFEREKKNGPWLSTELRAFAVGWHASVKDEFMLLRGKIHGWPQNGTQK